MIDKIIKDEEDLIVIGEDKVKTIIGSLFLFVFGAFLCWLNPIESDITTNGLLGFLVGGIISLWGLFKLLDSLFVDIFFIIDKKNQSIMMKKNSNIHFFNYLKTWKYSDIDSFKLRCNSDPMGNDSWSICLLPLKGVPTEIFWAQSKSDAEIIANKIGKITDIKISNTSPDI